MGERMIVDVDLVVVRREDNSVRQTLGWGDPVTVLGERGDFLEVEVSNWHGRRDDGSIRTTVGTGLIQRRLGGRDVVVSPERSRVLKVDFVDVQQGDGTLIETPGGRVLTIDGGDNDLFARYLAGHFRGTDAQHPRRIDAMIVSHGDADHFVGLRKIFDSESSRNPDKRLFVAPARVLHNGLVKHRGDDPETAFGKLAKLGEKTVITGLVESPLDVAEEQMNAPFKQWREALEAWSARSPIEFKRVSSTHNADALDFLASDGLTVDMLGPVETAADGKPGLEYLGTPSKRQPVAHWAREFGHGLDPSHTINGHSLVFRLTYGNWRLLFSGDLNSQSEGGLVADPRLRSEVFKVPHHGSHEFHSAFIEKVAPLISIVSSGDEGRDKEYIHPRATLMSALGRYGRDDTAIVFVTELVAFFTYVGRSATLKAPDVTFDGFRREAFGIVRVRTDGHRLLTYTDSASSTMKEAYAFEAEQMGEPKPVKLRAARQPLPDATAKPAPRRRPG